MSGGRTVHRERLSAGGFTLVEILVVMVLLAVVMLALGTALRTFAQTESRLDQRLRTSDEFRSATVFIRNVLDRVSTRKPEPESEPTDALVLFEAGRQSVAWIGVMPARYGAGGLYYFRLASETLGASNALVIRFKPCTGSTTFPDWAASESRILVSDLTSLDIRYQDNRVYPSEWSTDWSKRDRLPDRVEIKIQSDRTTWPAIVVPLRPLPGGGDRSTRFAIGGST